MHIVVVAVVDENRKNKIRSGFWGKWTKIENFILFSVLYYKIYNRFVAFIHTSTHTYAFVYNIQYAHNLLIYIYIYVCL